MDFRDYPESDGDSDYYDDLPDLMDPDDSDADGDMPSLELGLAPAA